MDCDVDTETLMEQTLKHAFTHLDSQSNVKSS